MSRRPFRFIGILFAACLALIALNRYLLHDALGDGILGLVGRPAASLFGRFTFGRAVIGEAVRWRSLVQENILLRDRIASLEAGQGRVEALERENGALRATIGLARSFDLPAVSVGVFRTEIGPGGAQALLNRGSKAGIGPDDVVVSEDGALIGRVVEAFPAYSRVQLVSDLRFEAAARVLGSDTKGIVRGRLDKGLALDLIVQTDAVREGDTVVTHGTDRYPAGLVIGTVEHVASDEAKVFKEVRIAPAFIQMRLDRVTVFLE